MKKKKILSLLLAGAMIGQTAFSNFGPMFVSAAETEMVKDTDLTDKQTAAPAADDVVPDANQYKYQKDELAGFCHFGPNTFNEIEWGENYGDRAPSDIFKLRGGFDAESLVVGLKNAGFKKLIVTAKHHDGFCIWASDFTTYDVDAAGYTSENGDVLADISAACTKYNMDMGLYLSPWDIHEPSYGYYDKDGNPLLNDDGTPKNGMTWEEVEEADVLDYNEYYNNQLEEILGNPKYGNGGQFVEVWMDGAKGSGASRQDYTFETWFNTIQKHEGKAAGREADCMLFGAQAYTTVRWIGNENGYAADETWSKSKVNKENNTINSNSSGGFTKGFEDGNQWTVPESDARITSGWFWGNNKKTPKTVEALGLMYFNSVGHNSPLLLNIPPNNQGKVDEAILNRLAEFGDNIKETFDENLAADATVSATTVRGNDIAYKPGNVLDGDDATYWTTDEGVNQGSLVVDLGSAKTFDVVSIEEAIQFGQRIKEFKVEYRNGDTSAWKLFDQGSTIGAKRLSRKGAVKATQLKITVKTSAKVPMLSEVGVFKATKEFEILSSEPDGIDNLDINDSNAFTNTSGWNSESGSQYINNTNKYASTGKKLTLQFTGTKVYLLGTIDPNHGTADISIDGTKVATIDTNAASRKVGQRIFESADLTDGAHTLELTVTNKAIGIEAAYVINNGGTGMIQLDNTQYTMDEDSTMNVVVNRVGGTSGKVTALLEPNPGTAIQDDFDTTPQTVTFEDGEATKTVPVRTRRNTNETGDLQFTIELTTPSPEDLIIGFNKKATVTIKDTESNVPEDTYTEEKAFVFPKYGEAAKTLEAEHFILHNVGTEPVWFIQISDKDWASNGKIVNAMNNGDTITLHYNAEEAGTYKAVVTYRSGDDKNGFSWAENDGKIEAGSVVMGANDQASADHTKEITFEVKEAGQGVLVLTAAEKNAPQLDKFEITKVTAPVEPEEPDTEAPTAPMNVKAENIGKNNADISWEASTDNKGVVRYEVYNGTAKVGETTATSLKLTGLTAGTTYTLSVYAYDEAENRSAAETVTFTTDKEEEPVKPVEKDKLEEIHNDCKEDLDKESYAPEVSDKYESILNEVDEILKNPDATEEEVQEAYEVMQEVKLEMVARTQVQTYYGECLAYYKKADYADAAKEWDAYEKALADVAAVVADKDAGIGDIRVANEALGKAAKVLNDIKNAGPNPDTEPDTEPDTKPETDPDKKPEPEKPDSPETGDHAPAMVTMFLFLTAGVAATALAVRKRREN